MAKKQTSPEPLSSIEAEQAVLGALLIDPHAIVRVSETVGPLDFWRGQHRFIYGAILRLWQNQGDIDLLTVSDYLENKGYLDNAGGIPYLSKLISETPTSMHAEHYARIVRNLARRRRLSDMAGRVAGLAYDKARELDDVLAEADRLFFEATADMVDDAMLNTSQLMSSLYDNVETAMQRQGVLGVPTGWPDVDKLMGGLHKSDLTILAARPSVGKTASLLNVCMNASKAGKSTLLISLEMSADQLAQRMACIESGLDTQNVRQGKFNDGEFLRLMDAMQRITPLPIHVVWTGSKDPAELRATARKHQAEHGLDLLAIDYLQLMTSDDGVNRREQVDSISRALKLLAKDLDVPIIANAQLSRGVEQRQDKRPMLSDLRESGALEQDADQVVFLYRHELYEPEDATAKGRMEWIVAKNRNGPIGTCFLYMRPYCNQVVGTRIVRQDGGLQIRMPLDGLD